MSNPRIQPGGGALSFGAWNSAGLLSTLFAIQTRSPATTNPISGERTSALTVSCTLPQLIPSPKALSGLMMEFIRPTPTMEPMSVCELEAGRPRYHVPRFQMMADRSSEKTIANPAPDPTLITSSTGSSATIPNATAPEDVSTPMRFQQPDHTTA